MKKPQYSYDGGGKQLLLTVALATMIALSMFLFNSYAVQEDSQSKSSLELMESFHVSAESLREAALSGVVSYQKEYYIPETTIVCAEPDKSCYHTVTDDSEISAIVSASDLVCRTPLVWQEGTAYYEDAPRQLYSDRSIFALCWKEQLDNHIVDFAEIVIANGSQFRRLLCDNQFGSNNQKYASTMASSVNAVIAMNGDFYSNRQAGVLVYQRKVYRNNPQFLENCFINSEGDMLMPEDNSFGSDEEFQKYVDDNDIRFSLSFGPVLVRDGQPLTYIGNSYGLGEVKENYARAALGMIGERHYLFCLVEGGKGGFVGTDIVTMAQIMAERGCDKAYTLDGGQTAEIIINDTLYNRVVHDAERQMSDIIYFATAEE